MGVHIEGLETLIYTNMMWERCETNVLAEVFKLKNKSVKSIQVKKQKL